MLRVVSFPDRLKADLRPGARGRLLAAAYHERRSDPLHHHPPDGALQANAGPTGIRGKSPCRHFALRRTPFRAGWPALSASKSGAIEAHVETCVSCQAAVEVLLGRTVKKRGPAGPQGEDQAEVEFIVRQAEVEPNTVDAAAGRTPRASRDGRPLPTIEGYEILEEIGRGGMGLVCKAWQRDLNRLVAIKMVHLDAGGPESLIRFHQEAELSARLQHPNIVGVYEIGQWEQRPYLVMEYVAGGTLAAKCKKQPQPPLQAAALVEVLARTIDHAHRKDVLHRDLKPSNVLLTAEGEPKIADFGLATCIAVQSELTATGAALGTPGYMAPEQARKREGRIGPAADVYALGVILYEQLTGRLPVPASELMDFLLRLEKEEPIPPRRLQPGVPRNLEVVCLKCLRKDPRHRYASAEALADDLRRFLDGKPVAARPASMVERAWRWAKRNPTLAGALSASAGLLIVLAVGASVAAVLFRGERNRAVEAEEQTSAQKVRAEQLLAEALRSVAGEVRGMRLRGERGAYFRGMPKLRAALAKARELNAPEDVIRALRDEMGNLVTVGDVEITREWDDFLARAQTIQFAPNLDRYARGQIDGEMTVHETGTGKELSRLPVAVHLVSSAICFSPDGRRLVFSARKNRVVCWGVEAPRATLRREVDGNDGWMSPDGKAALYTRPTTRPRSLTPDPGRRSGASPRAGSAGGSRSTPDGPGPL